MNSENMTPASTAVASPLNVPMNSIGIPIVNSISHKTCVFLSLTVPIIFHTMMKYPIAVKNAIPSIDIIFDLS